MVAMDTNMMTISRYITEQQRNANATGEFTQLMNSLVVAIKAISSAVRIAGLNNLMGLAGQENATGDDQASGNFYFFFSRTRLEKARCSVKRFGDEYVEVVFFVLHFDFGRRRARRHDRG
jgi:hypothetical protein